MDIPISRLKGIGKKRSDEFKKLNINLVSDLAEFYPRTYEDRTVSKTISQFEDDHTYTFPAYIASEPKLSHVNGKALVNARINDGTGSVYVTWFNQPYLKNSLHKGDGFLFTGKVQKRGSRISMASPEREPLPPEDELYEPKILPIYPLSGSLTQRIMRTAVKTVLDNKLCTFTEFIPPAVRKKYNLCEKNFAVQNIHFPDNENSLETSRYRLVFEEFFLIQVLLTRIRLLSGKANSGIVFEDTETEDFVSSLPFSLTNSQAKTVEDIKGDFSSGKLTNRLIQGDVGSGKTVIAQIAAYMAYKNGYQTALMAPTEILAQQHFESFMEIFEPLGISCTLLTGSSPTKEKELIYQKIASGEADIIIGTHAIIQEKTVFSNLGLVISDEQHRFGVKQRKSLSQKGKNVHTLIMTATPIPRTLALMIYGDMDISSMTDMPPGRKTVKTYCVNSTYRKRFFEFIKKNAASGGQTYIICPLIEDSENSNLQSVNAYIETAKKALSPYNIEAVHGKMTASEKNRIMEDFASGKIDVLVSTTVIEVGINVPNATIMVIENAEKFGLSQLHQLRGRVGRGEKDSYCILVTDSQSEISGKRMEIMKKSSDGFEIAEKDLSLRGPGDFFGTSQHGLPKFKLADIYRDIEILKLAKTAAEEILKKDLYLKNEENLNLLDKIEKIHDTLRLDI